MEPQTGVYKNPRLMHVTTSVVGHVVHLQTKDGKIWEGILSTFSPEFTICLELAIQLDPKQEDDCLYAALKRGSQAEKQAFFDLKDIVRISVADVDLNYATKDTASTRLATDSDISGFDASKLSEHRELESWQDDGDNVNSESFNLSLDDVANKSGNQKNTKGWDAQDMFTFNQRVHNVKSTYDEQLSEYTVPVPKHQGKEWVQKRERAEALAKEIEGSSTSQSRLAKEDGSDCEEEKFSAVLRPTQNATSNTTTNTNTNNAPTTVNNSINVKNYPRQRSSFPTRQRPNNYQRAANSDMKSFHQKFTIGSPRPPRNQQQSQPHPVQSQQSQLQHPHQSLQHHSQPSNQHQQPSHQHQHQQHHHAQPQSQSQPLKQHHQAPPSQSHPPHMQSNQVQSAQQSHASPANRGHQQHQQIHQQSQSQSQSQTPAQPQQQQSQAQPQQQPQQPSQVHPPPSSQPTQAHHPQQTQQQSQQATPPSSQTQPQHPQQQQSQPQQQQQQQQQQPQPQPQQQPPQQHPTQPHAPQSQPTQVQNTQQSPQQQPQQNTPPSSQTQQQAQQQPSQQHQTAQTPNQQNNQKQDRATQSELVRKFKLNPNAKEFVYKPKSPTAAMQAAAQVNGQAGHVPAVPGAVMDPASSMSQAAHGAYYQQVPIFAHGIPPQQQHPAAQFMPNHTPLHFQSQLHYMSPMPTHFPPQQMGPRYIRGQFQNYHPRGGENHNNVRPVYSQSSMMPATSTGQPYVPPPSGAPHPMNAYAASPQQPMIYGGMTQSMYPVVQAGFPQHMPHVLPNPAPYDGSAVYMPPQNYVVNPH